MKLKRDWVITMTEDGDRVGVYDASTCGCEPLFECEPKLADKLIDLWNTSQYALELPHD
jgi:hypothetical protein